MTGKIVRNVGDFALPEQFCSAKRTKRFPDDLSKYEKHLKKMEATKHAVKCFVCGENTYKKCGICGVALHHFDNRGAGKDKNCFLQYHSCDYFGLCFGDRSLVGKTANDWKSWTNAQLRDNKERMKKNKENDLARRLSSGNM